jgi:hypothetical protein
MPIITAAPRAGEGLCSSGKRRTPGRLPREYPAWPEGKKKGGGVAAAPRKNERIRSGDQLPVTSAVRGPTTQLPFQQTRSLLKSDILLTL